MSIRNKLPEPTPSECARHEIKGRIQYAIDQLNKASLFADGDKWGCSADAISRAMEAASDALASANAETHTAPNT